MGLKKDFKRKKYDDIWLRPSDFPDDRDVERFGDDSPYDNKIISIGTLPKAKRKRSDQERFWTRKRIFIAIVMLTLLFAMFGPSLLSLLYWLYASLTLNR